jgi:hypothetical protein
MGQQQQDQGLCCLCCCRSLVCQVAVGMLLLPAVLLLLNL